MHSRSEIQRLLRLAGTTPRKSLGQNFVVDPNTLRRITDLAGEPAAGLSGASQVVEVGAGLGSLALALAETGATVLAIETDPKLVQVLREEVLAAQERVTVLHADALKLDWQSALGPGEWDLVANLPYNIATTLVLKVLEEAPSVKRLLVMCQKEVAERLAADVGNDGYGAVSVLVRMHAAAQVVGAVPATVFWPQPRVESALVRIVRHETDHSDDPALSPLSGETATAMRLLLRQAFGTRRKMLRRSLRGVSADSALSKDLVKELLAAAGIDETARPEQLNFESWVALSEALALRVPNE